MEAKEYVESLVEKARAAHDHARDKVGSYPANLCGSCGRFCPACDAPKA